MRQFIDKKLNASATEIGLFLSYFSLIAVLVNGFLVKRVVPAWVSVDNTLNYGLLLWTLEVSIYIICIFNSMSYFYFCLHLVPLISLLHMVFVPMLLAFM